MEQSSKRIWLLQDGEPLPCDDGARLMRTGLLSEVLAARGWDVTWFASRFNHTFKSERTNASPFEIAHNYRIYLLDGGAYRRNISVRRILHQRAVARSFLRVTKGLVAPNVLLLSYPTPELALAGRSFATARGLPYLVDIRDPWPDIFASYLAPPLRLLGSPLFSYYRKLARGLFSSANSLISSCQTMLQWSQSLANRPASSNDRIFYHAYPSVSEFTETLPLAPFSQADPLRCVFVGSFGQSYDIPMVIEAARVLARGNERRVVFSIIGDGERRSEWEALAKGVPQVEFTGWLSKNQLGQHLLRSHVGLLVMSKGVSAFTIPNKLGEYLGHGLAVLNSMPNEAAAIVSTMQVGETIAPGHAGDLAKLILRWLEEPALVAAYRARARTAFFQSFSAETVYNEYAKFIESRAEITTTRD